MSNESEKLTINLGVVDLAQIDVLVEQGIYANRSDFIRSAIRKDLSTYDERMQQQLTPIASKKEWEKVLGILILNKKILENFIKDEKKINISVIGMLVVDADVSAQLFKQTVNQVVLKGKLVAQNEIKEIIRNMN